MRCGVTGSSWSAWGDDSGTVDWAASAAAAEMMGAGGGAGGACAEYGVGLLGSYGYGRASGWAAV